MATRRGRNDEAGTSLVELLMVAAFASCLMAFAVPLTARVSDAAVGRAAAGFVAGRVRAVRGTALATSRYTAMVMADTPDGWTFRSCYDGNGDGVQRADMETGTDRCDAATQDIDALFPGVELELAAGIPDVDGNVEGAAREGVRFGRAAIVSCAPTGRCTPGTLYLRTRGGQQWAVRVAGATGRTRVLHFHPESSSWSEGP